MSSQPLCPLLRVEVLPSLPQSHAEKADRVLYKHFLGFFGGSALAMGLYKTSPFFSFPFSLLGINNNVQVKETTETETRSKTTKSKRTKPKPKVIPFSSYSKTKRSKIPQMQSKKPPFSISFPSMHSFRYACNSVE